MQTHPAKCDHAKKTILFTAKVVKKHISVFHIPYLQWFKNRRVQTHVCAHNDYDNPKDCVIPYCDVFYDTPFYANPIKSENFAAYRQLKQLIEKNEYSIIHCHTPIAGALTRMAAIRARRRHTIVIYTAHGFHFYHQGPWLYWLLYYPIERFLARYTDILITVNREDYQRALRFKAKTVVYVPGVGIDVKKFKNSTTDREQTRTSLGISPKTNVLLSVGELNRNKNHQTVLKALSQLKNRNWVYVICGDGPMKVRLHKTAHAYGIQDRVLLLGHCTAEDMKRIYGIADVFVFPSLREGLSVALLEAMACALPVIASKIRGNREVLDDKKGGYLVDAKKTKSYADSIVSLLENHALREKMGAYNQRKVNAYDIRQVMSVMDSVYEKALNRSR